MLSQTELERERYESARMARLDQASFAEEMRRIQDGLRQAEERIRRAHERVRQAEERIRRALDDTRQAQERGELIGRVLVSQRILKQPLTPKEELLALALPDLARLADQLEQQLPGA